jgi:hypothetical protein
LKKIPDLENYKKLDDRNLKGTTRARNEDTRTESKKKKAGRQKLGTRKEKIEVATWNVRSTYMEGN